MSTCGYQGSFSSNCSCNFSTLIILILILLQFGKGRNIVLKEECDDEYKDEKRYGIDNGILFIVAIFYLSCVLQCK